MPALKERACTILGEFEQAQTELVGKAVILTDGKAGTVESVCLDEMHRLRISIRCHEGKWPVSTIKSAQTARDIPGSPYTFALAGLAATRHVATTVGHAPKSG